MRSHHTKFQLKVFRNNPIVKHWQKERGCNTYKLSLSKVYTKPHESCLGLIKLQIWWQTYRENLGDLDANLQITFCVIKKWCIDGIDPIYEFKCFFTELTSSFGKRGNDGLVIRGQELVTPRSYLVIRQNWIDSWTVACDWAGAVTVKIWVGHL